MRHCRFLSATLCLIIMALASVSARAEGDKGDVMVEMVTDEGSMTLRLFGDTPLHRDNFVKLVNEGYYDGLLFHRVINDFMVQTGDPGSRDAKPGKRLGDGSPDYTIEAEIRLPGHFHRRGAIAAARKSDNVNPQQRSDGSQFYIVTGRRFTSGELDRMEMDLIRRQRESIAAGRLPADTPLGFSREQIEAYTTAGGTPHLDASYTVFGQVEKGFDVIQRIQTAECDTYDRPVKNIRIISMKVIK